MILTDGKKAIQLTKQEMEKIEECLTLLLMAEINNQDGVTWELIKNLRTKLEGFEY